MATSKAPIFNQIKTWLDEVDNVKSAAAKSKKEGKAPLDPGSVGGATKHPSKDVDNHTYSPNEGAHYKELEEGIKKDIGEAAVDNTSEGGGGTQEDKQMQVGTTKSEVGGQPSVEDDFKGDKDDPGTTHPANAEDVGKKYGSYNLRQLLNMQKQASDQLLAAIAVSVDTIAGPKTQTRQKQADSAPSAAGSTAANLGLNKSAADEQAKTILAGTIKEACDDADRVGPFVLGYLAEKEKIAKEAAVAAARPLPKMPMPPLNKKAAGGGEEGEDHATMPGGGPPGGMPPGAGGEMGGPPPEAGGAPPGAGGPPGAEGGIQELLNAALESGIPPEQLIAMIQQMEGGQGGGGPPPEAGPPPDANMAAGGGMPGGDMGGEGAKMASAVKKYVRDGKFHITEAKTAQQRAYRDEMKGYIREIADSCRR